MNEKNLKTKNSHKYAIFKTCTRFERFNCGVVLYVYIINQFVRLYRLETKIKREKNKTFTRENAFLFRDCSRVYHCRIDNM